MQMFDSRRDPDSWRRCFARLDVVVFEQMQERECETAKAIEEIVGMKHEAEATK